ncbi:hypothetical protein O0L34_g9833 [Tuta absoluta]|nr:hypothetical protein O0L34_g9833 [Tuta absoluta]
MAENSALIPEPVAMYTQPETKDAKDLSKNLVSGDFERQYRDGLMEKPGWRRQRHAYAIIGAAIGLLTCWMLIHTLVREVQITRLRNEVDELTANMIALTANIKNVNQKLSNNRLFDDFKHIEDTVSLR